MLSIEATNSHEARTGKLAPSGLLASRQSLALALLPCGYIKPRTLVSSVYLLHGHSSAPSAHQH
jgi:hypothetical protein